MSDSSAWCLPVVEPGSPYLQVDFGEDVLVCAVETRGYDDDGEELYAQEFTLSFEADGESSFTEYMEDGEIRVRTKFGYLSVSTLQTFLCHTLKVRVSDLYACRGVRLSLPLMLYFVLLTIMVIYF